MNASISSIAVSANARAAAPPRLPPKAEDVFKQIDSEGKGSVTASDAAAYLVKISPEGARKADAADSSAASKLKQDIEQELGKADADGNGQLSQAEFKQALAQGPAGGRRAGADADGDGDGDKGVGAAAGRSKGAGRPAGPPPGAAGGAGGGGAKAGGASAAGSSSSASTNYEKEDANRDGKVTEPERQAYAVQHPKQAAAEATQNVKTATAASAVRAASDLALQRYQEVASIE
ncbi:hypothetical protein LNV09_00855 [Paucibacter sp. B2R-40]|uniref:hypothetical protein n=1 Tax=Paucibacter sp. B2R-40 TaxID=2893554 RepID=UPI0021E4E6BD|nr:hypothetical protein [Paucibacter sp. B2R-40]MCV2352702.1 hypothetical protein [Paucibacter sp. B2R-40]